MKCGREGCWRERGRRGDGERRRSGGVIWRTWVDGGGALGGRRGRGIRQGMLGEDALDVVQGVGDDELEGSERRERRRRGWHGGEEGDVMIRMGRSL